MTNDIEAAAKALALQFDLTYLRERNTCASEAEARTAGWLAVARHALAHAERGEGGPPPWHAPCVLCGHRQSAHNTDTGPCSKCGCDCAAFRPTPPPATGEAGRRSASIDALRRIARAAKPFAFYARSLTGVPGEYLMRVPKDEADEIQRAVDAIWGTDDYATPPTPPPATGEAKWPEIRDSGGRTDFALTPATGEAGTREAEIRADERERCAKWHDERAETSGNERASWWHKDCAAAIRALPEAREGKSKTHG